jgi:hypothetical protein
VREREREREVEMEGKREMGNIQRAMLMLCFSPGGTHSDFYACGWCCRHISAAALKSCSERAKSKIKGRMVFGQSRGLSRPGHASRK